MIVEKQMECRLAGETEVLGENLPQRHFCPSQNPPWPDSGLNPGRRGGKPATNRLSYGAARTWSSCWKTVILKVPGSAKMCASLCFCTRKRQHHNPIFCIGKGKDIPVTGRGGTYGCERSRLPHCLDKRLIDGGRPLPSGFFFKLPGTHFC
jgi:hypothetical protein